MTIRKGGQPFSTHGQNRASASACLNVLTFCFYADSNQYVFHLHKAFYELVISKRFSDMNLETLAASTNIQLPNFF